MKLCVLGSGSKGNAVLIQSGDTRVLVDAGFSSRVMKQRLASIGVDPRSIEAVLVTHEHVDHVKGVAVGTRRWGWRVFATAGTAGACASMSQCNEIAAGSEFQIGDILFSAVGTSHDAEESVAFVATAKSTGVRAGIVYDLGMITESVQQALDRVDILVIESNHDGEMLRNGPYPPTLKRRIASREGHLSNRAAGVAAAECAHREMSHVVLAHLSEINNTPQTATESMRFALRRTPFHGCIVAASQDAPSSTITTERVAAFGPAQLSLSL